MTLKLGRVKTLNYIKFQMSGSTVHVDRLTALILHCKFITANIITDNFIIDRPNSDLCLLVSNIQKWQKE